MSGLESDLDLVLFGPPRALHAGDPLHFERHKTLALLAYLAVTGRPHARDSLAILLWPEADAVQGRGGLRRALSELRQAFGPGILDTSEGCVALASGALRVDVLQFHSHLTRVAAHAHEEGALCPACITALREAVELARGDFLAGFSLRETEEFDAWQTLTTETLRLELSAALERLATALVERQEYAAALPYARRWLALDPLHEPAHRLLMRLYAAMGDRAAAARQYEQCVHTLSVELGIAPAPETAALHHTLLAAATSSGALSMTSPAARPAHNLPPDVTPFIGREAQLAQVAARLADPACRLLTVLGPGGIGKTRLALQAARDEVAHFAQGVWFVDLAPLTTAEQLAGTILSTLGVTEHGAAGAEARLREYLADRQLLLVLDNYEHLLTGQEIDRRDGYGLVMQVVGAAPGVKLLVTSRARLNVAAEWLAPLDGLAWPAAAPPERLRAGYTPATVRATLAQYSATELFVRCLERLQPGLVLSGADGHTIAHICRLLEGVPLAIELAAVWTRSLPLDEIARRLEHGLALLTTSLRGVPPRQRSMVATFDYSWRLLTVRQRAILRQLAVFQGGFTPEAAEAVTGAGLSELAALVDASWLRLGEGGRYGVHELIRQYCAERLAQEHEAESGELPDAIRARHACFFQPLVVDLWLEAWQRRELIHKLGLERPNLMVAWEWSIAAVDLQGLWMLILGLCFMADRQGSRSDISALLEAGLQALRARPRSEQETPDLAVVVAMLLGGLSEMRERSGRIAEASKLLNEARQLLAGRALGARRWAEANYLERRMRAWLLQDMGDVAESARIFLQLCDELQTGSLSLPPYTPDGSRLWHIEASWGAGFALVAQGEYGRALQLMSEAIVASDQACCDLLRAYATRVQVLALMYTGALDEAEAAARWMTSTASAFDDKLLLGQALYILGQTQLALGRPKRARACFLHSIEVGRDVGMREISAGTLCLLGHAELALGNPSVAERYFREASDAGGLAGSLYGRARLALYGGELEAARALCRQTLARPGLWALLKGQALMRFAEATARLGEPESAAELCGFLLAWRGTTYSARQDADKLVRELTAALPADIHAAALSRGAARELSAVIAEITSEGS
jgi:predicted ATPase/DNA-binding SARP family transcriptional activator